MRYDSRPKEREVDNSDQYGSHICRFYILRRKVDSAWESRMTKTTLNNSEQLLESLSF